MLLIDEGPKNTADACVNATGSRSSAANACLNATCSHASADEGWNAVKASTRPTLQHGRAQRWNTARRYCQCSIGFCVWHLQKVIGLARASEMFYTGDPIDAATALEWGLVSKVVPLDSLMDEARALAERVVRQPPDVLRMTKVLLRTAQTGDIETVLEMSAAMQGVAHHTEDHLEAINAFFEKRPGNFKGQ